MAATKIQTGLRLEEGLYRKLKCICNLEGRSINNLMEYIARLYVADFEKSHGTISPPPEE